MYYWVNPIGAMHTVFAFHASDRGSLLCPVVCYTVIRRGMAAVRTSERTARCVRDRSKACRLPVWRGQCSDLCYINHVIILTSWVGAFHASDPVPFPTLRFPIIH